MTVVPYEEPGYGFKTFQAANPTTPLPGDKLDIELNTIADAITTTQEQLAVIQRSDGTLQYSIVTPSQLSNSTLALIEGDGVPYASWTASKLYNIRDLVNVNDATYICCETHTSTASFDVDKAAGKWALFATPVKGDPRIYSSTFTGTGAQTAFALPISPASVADVFVYLNGTLQVTGYTILGTTLTFSVAPSLGVQVHFRVAATLVDNAPTDITGKTIQYYSQTPRIESLLDKSINIVAAGCVADGTTDNSPRFQQLVDTANANNYELIIPPVPAGQFYKFNTGINLSATLWNAIHIKGVNREGAVLKFANNGDFFNITQGAVHLENLTIGGTNGTPLPNTAVIKGGLSRASLKEIEVFDAITGVDVSGSIDTQIDGLRITRCTDSLKSVNTTLGDSPGFRAKNLYIDFCTNGLQLRNLLFTELHGWIEFCTTGAVIDNCFGIDFDLWFEACTQWGKLGAMLVRNYKYQLAGVSAQPLNLSGAVYRPDANQDLGFLTATRDVVLYPMPYDASFASDDTAGRYARYTGFGATASDSGVFKGILTQLSKAAGLNAAGSAVVKHKRASGFGVYNGVPTSVLADFVEIYSSFVKLYNWPTYADNAAAVAGGLPVGACYMRTGGALALVV